MAPSPPKTEHPESKPAATEPPASEPPASEPASATVAPDVYPSSPGPSTSAPFEAGPPAAAPPTGQTPPAAPPTGQTPPAAPPTGQTPTSTIQTPPPAIAEPPTDPTPDGESATSEGNSDDRAAGVRALQEAFAIDVAEREDRHRAEVRAMQQSFMTDVAAREERHRAEVQVLHQRLAAEIAEREDRHRNDVAQLQSTLDSIRAQLNEAASGRDRETEARAGAEIELERLRVEIETQTAEIARLNVKSSDLASALAATRQQADQWSDRAARLDKELAALRDEADKDADRAARMLDDKSRQYDDTAAQLEDTTRRLAVAEERGNRLADQSAAHEAAANQLRTTVSEQRTERERITAERDEARQQAAEFEAQLRRVEFEAEQADEEGNRHLNEAARKLELAEEKTARVAGQVQVHEATIEELRKALADQQLEMKKVAVDRDAARRRVSALEGEVARLEGETPAARVDDVGAPPVESSAVEREPEATVVPIDVAVVGERPLSLAEDIELVEWQREALAAWVGRGHRGVVEAITGAGKTQLAYWAIAEALEQDMKVLVITPSAQRVDHWFAGLRAALPINRVGKWTGGREENPTSYDVVVATAVDAAKERVSGSTFEGLIVADQVHAYGTRDLSLALDPRYAWRLGLTAAYERDDNGVTTYLDPFFGGAVFRLGYERALREEVVAPFDIATVSVRLNSAEQSEYDALAQQAAALGEELVTVHGVPAGPAHAFATSVVALADGRMGPPRTAARAYQKALAKQDEIVTKASAKMSVLKALATYVRDNAPALLFAESPDDAAQIVKTFNGAGCPTRPLNGGGERKPFGRRGDEPQEAEDIVVVAGSGAAEDASLGIVVGANRDSGQLIQRLGAVIRNQPDARHGRLVLLSVDVDADVDAEDASAAHEVITKYAAEHAEFGTGETDALLAFLTHH